MSLPLSSTTTLSPPKNGSRVASFTPGSYIFPGIGEPFRIVSSINKKDGQCYKIAFKNGDVKSVSGGKLSLLSKKTAGQIRLANVFKFLSFNQDFNLYVRSAITEHGLPIDEKMHWSKWLETSFKSTVPQEERRDEALHNMLIHTLFEIDILNNFDASRLNEDNQAKPLAEQVTVYLKNYFLYQKSKVVKWLNDTYGTSDELLIMDGGNKPTDSGEPSPVLEHGEIDENQQSVIRQADLEKFRSLFTKWMERLPVREKARGQVLACMTVILDSPAMKSSQLIEELTTKLTISEFSAQRIFHKSFPSFVQKFLQTPEGKMLNKVTEEPGLLIKSNMEEPMRSRRTALQTNPNTVAGPGANPAPQTLTSPNINSNPATTSGAKPCINCGQKLDANGRCPKCSERAKKEAFLKRKKADEIDDMPEKVKPSFKDTPSAKDVEHTTITVDNERHLPSMPGEPEGSKIKVTAKYATLRRVAEEEPKELSHALGELAEAFSSLADASEALMENLDLTSAGEAAPLSEKVASRKKFASALRKIAGENPEAVEEAVQELYHSLDEIAEAIENLAGNLDIDLGIDEDEDMTDFEDTTVPENAEPEFDEPNGEDKDLVEFDEEIGANASDILDSYEKEIVSSRKGKKASGVVCHTQSGGDWTEFTAGQETELMTKTDGTNWDIQTPHYAKQYLAKGPIYILTESDEPIATYSPSTGVYVDAEDAPADEAFAEELAELKACLDKK